MAKEQSLNGNADTILGLRKETPLDEGSSCSRSRPQKNKRNKANRKAKAKAKIMVHSHSSAVASLESHTSVKDSESAPLKIDRDTSTEAGVRLEICLPPKKKQKRKRKQKGGVSLKRDALDSRCTKDTSVDVIPVHLYSDLHHMSTTCLADNSEMIVHATEPTSALSIGDGNQQMCSGGSTMNDSSQEGGFSGNCIAKIGALKEADEHSGLRVVEELDSSKKYLDACSVEKYHGDSGPNSSSFNLSDNKTYQLTSVKDSESAPLKIDRDTSTEAGVRLEICLPPKKKQKRKRKQKGGVSLKSDAIDSRCTKDTSVDVIPVHLYSDLHHMSTTCLADNSEMIVHATEPTSALSIGDGNQQMCSGASTMNDSNQEGGFSGSCIAKIGALKEADEHSGLRVVEELDSSKKYLDACSVEKYHGDSGSNSSSFNLSDNKTYQRGRSSDSSLIETAFSNVDNMSSMPAPPQESLRGDTSVGQRKDQVTYYSRRKKRSASHLSSLESLRESASPSEMSMKNSSAGDSPMDHLDQAVASGIPETIMGEVVATVATSLLVAGDIVMGEACGECPDDFSVSKEEKTKEIKDSEGIVSQHSLEKDESFGDLPEKDSTLNKSSKVERYFVADKSNQAEKISVLDKSIEVGKNSVLDTGNNAEAVENAAKQETLQEPATSDNYDNTLGVPSLTHTSIGHIVSDGMGIPSSLENTVASSSQLNTTEDSSSLAVNAMGSPQRALDISTSLSRKKLLVLDVNGILADIFIYGSERRKPDIVVSGKAVFKRPFCDDFLQFCFERFHVGVWSSRTKRNVGAVVNFLMPKSKDKLLFCWDQSHCTETGFNNVENREKPLVLKELKHLWEKNMPGLPWKRGEYNESNTLLLDDSPYKALRNPPYTAIFPHPYKYLDRKDTCLGPGGDLRLYLEGLAEADDVQTYVKLHPFGQRAITERNASWRFYLKVIGTSTTSVTVPQPTTNSTSIPMDNA